MLETRKQRLTVNAYGNQMLGLCKSTDIFILNGRLGNIDKNMKHTSKDKSVVDYMLSTAHTFCCLRQLQVLEFHSLLSDAHRPLSITVTV